MDNEETSDDSIRRRLASEFVYEMLQLGGDKSRHGSRAIAALDEALRWTRVRPLVATPERDERTRDLEELTAERDAALADVARANHALSVAQDSRDEMSRLRELSRQTCEAAQERANKAITELEKTRGVVEQLREQLAAPTVQSAAVKAWLEMASDTKYYITQNMRSDSEACSGWHRAADVLDLLSMQAPAPTDAADDVAKLRTRVSLLEIAIRVYGDAAEAWRALRSDQRSAVRRVLRDRCSESKDPMRWTAALTVLELDTPISVGA